MPQPGQVPPGGYGPPPGTSWGAPQPGYGQPQAPGGFPPPGQPPYPGGPGGPGWGGPGGPSGGNGNRRTTTIITVVASVVLLAVVAVVLGMALSGRDDEETTAGGRSSSSSSSAGGFTPDPGPTDPGTPGTTDPEEFLGLLPSDLTACVDSPTTGDGDVAAATCGPALTQPGPLAAEFSLYPDQETLDAGFLADAGALGIEEWPVGEEDCDADTGYGEWTYADGTTGGLVGCGLSPEGDAVLVWTDDEFGAAGSVRVPGGTQAEIADLYEWWTLNSNFGS